MRKSPRQALRDRAELSFSLNVMRGHDEFKKLKFKTVMDGLKKAKEVKGVKDDFGLNQIFQALRLLVEDE